MAIQLEKLGAAALKRYRVECKQCGAIFTYEQEDINPDQRDGDYVICPCCSQWINATLGAEVKD